MKKLMESYLTLVKKNIADSVPAREAKFGGGLGFRGSRLRDLGVQGLGVSQIQDVYQLRGLYAKGNSILRFTVRSLSYGNYRL